MESYQQTGFFHSRRNLKSCQCHNYLQIIGIQTANLLGPTQQEIEAVVQQYISDHQVVDQVPSGQLSTNRVDYKSVQCRRQLQLL